MDYNSWMKDIPDSKNIADINIPGTHDSSTEFCQLSLFTRCQNLSISEMLNIGVRVLDIRVDRENVVHAFAKCKNKKGEFIKIYNVINDVLEFLKVNTSETVIMFFKYDAGGNDEKESLDILINNIINKNPEMWYLENKVPCLFEARGKIILVNRVDSSIGIDFSLMPWQGGKKETKTEVFMYNSESYAAIQDRYSLVKRKKWNRAIIPILENRKDYENMFIYNNFATSGFPLIPYYNSIYINRQFMKYKLKNKAHYGMMVFDFINMKISEKVIASNF